MKTEAKSNLKSLKQQQREQEPLQIPHNLSAEVAVVGVILQEPWLFTQVYGRLKPGDFYSPKAEKIYKAMCRLYERNEEITLITVTGEVASEISYSDLAKYMEHACLPSMLDSTIEEIKDYSYRRWLLKFCDDLKTSVFDGEKGKNLIAEAQLQLFQALQNDKAEWELNKELLARHVETIEARLGQTGITGVPSGFDDLDKHTGGWQPGNLIFLGACPKAGKTSMALHFALAASRKVPVLFFTLEMMPEELADRQLAIESGVDSFKIKTGMLQEDEFPEITRSMARLAEHKIGWVKKTGLSVGEIKALCQRFKVEHGLGLVIIDQLDKIGLDRKSGENKTDAIGRVTSGLKAIARDLEVPVICLVQLLDKAVASRSNPRPRSGDVRDSSYPDQDADVMLYLWRPEIYYHDDKWKNLAEIIVARQRAGESGVSVWVRWERRRTEFQWLAKEYWPKKADEGGDTDD